MNTTNKSTHNATFEQPGYTDSAVLSETTYEIPCQHIPTHVNVNNEMRQASVGMDSSEAVYDMPPAHYRVAVVIIIIHIIQSWWHIIHSL